jgi:cobalt-zinc-cadmium efflux system outer membrane protein
MSSRIFAFVVAAGVLLATPCAALAQSIDSLTLDHAERLMRQRNRELQAARRAVEAARANTTMAGARLNPTLSLGVGAINPQLGIGGGAYRDKTVDTSVRLDQVIERGERRELRIAAAKNLESASAEDLSDTLRQQRLALHGAYYDLMFAQDRSGIARDTASLFGRTLDAAELRLKAGDIAAADVARIRVDALRAANDARAAEADLRRAQLALAYLIGAEAEAARLRAADGWPAGSGLETVALTEDMIDRRPDVKAARKRVDAAAAARELARSLRTRDVSVGVQYDHYPASSSNTLGSGNSYGLSVSVPLFARYHFEGEIERAEVDYSTAQESLERTRAIARGELERALSDLRAATERVRRYEGALLAEAKRAADAAEFAYRNGAIGVMDLLDARRTLHAVQNDAAAARNDFSKALAAWSAALASDVEGKP